MSGDDLRVTTAHLGELAVKQGRAAVGIRSATIAAEGVEAAVRSTHGSIASASVSALAAVLTARRGAGSKLAAISDELCDKLAEAAKQYDLADEAMSATLGTQMQVGQR
jgi:Excreted virulence factor EspC, type VII ESX diderm